MDHFTLPDLRSRHDTLVHDVKQLIHANEVAFEDVISHIMSLPTERIGEQYNYVLKHSEETEIDHFMSTYMHFMDIRLLKELVAQYARRETHCGLVERMKEYEMAIGDYCQHTTVRSFTLDLHGEEKVPKFFTTLEVKCNLDSDKSSIKELGNLQRKLGKGIGLCLRPQMTECAMVLHKVVLTSFSVTWLIPTDVEPDLLAALTEPQVKTLLETIDVNEVVIGGESRYKFPSLEIEDSNSNSHSQTLFCTPSLSCPGTGMHQGNQLYRLLLRSTVIVANFPIMNKTRTSHTPNTPTMNNKIMNMVMTMQL
jgi:hypothetical protein